MAASGSSKIYEELGVTPVAACGIRPGGLCLTNRALSLCSFGAGSSVLDIGCGTGITLEHLTRAHGLDAVGVDSSSFLLEQSRDSSLLTVMASGDQLPFPGRSFDGVLLECALSLMDDALEVLRECHRVLRVDGNIIVTDVYAQNACGIGKLRDLRINSCVRGALNLGILTRDLGELGFAIKAFEDHSHLFKTFAAQVIWQYGSLAKFWIRAGCNDGDLARVEATIRQSRPGYFLLVGRKTAFRH
jgi:arsenite methyltransferase